MAIPALFVEDVMAGVKGRCPVKTYLRDGGNIVEREEIIERIKKIVSGSEG